MQAAQNKQTDAQIQSQIQNQRWSEHENSVNAAYIREAQQRQLSFQEQQWTSQAHVAHEQWMVDHLATPVEILGGLAIIGFVVIRLGLRSIAAGIERNRDDNQADVIRAQEILDAQVAHR